MGVLVHYRFVLLFSMLALLAGCFFETRDPPPPELGGGCNFDYEFNDSFEDVLYNLEGALGCADAAEYMRMITQEFLYLPPPGLSSDPAFAEPWDNSRENVFITSTLGQSRFAADLNVSTSNFQDLGDVIRLTALYTIQEVDADGNEIGPLYTDEANFEFRSSGGLWTLELWQDTEAFPDALPFGQRRADQGGGV